MTQIPFFIMSDNPLGNTGLARIGGDLATLISTKMPDVFRVGYIGFGGPRSRHLPYELYPIAASEDAIQFPHVWEDLAGDEPGILFTIMNPAWLKWLAFPEQLPDGELKTLLMSGKVKKWAYIPVDAVGPGGKLIRAEKEIIERMDRVLAYTAFGSRVIDRTVEWKNPPHLGACPHLPPGIDSSIFYPRDRHEARHSQFMRRVLKVNRGYIKDSVLLLGVVATNTPRKDWGLAFEILADLKARGIDVGMWAHTDRAEGAWDLNRLADAFGVKNEAIITEHHLSHAAMSWGYAACSVTLSIGAGEGWGFTGAESLACGVPTIHGNYSGQTEYMPPELLIEPCAWRWDGTFCCRRPVFRAADWVDRILEYRDAPCKLFHEFTWDGAWPAWEKWLREGLQ